MRKGFTLAWLIFSARSLILLSVSSMSFPTSLLFLSSSSCKEKITTLRQQALHSHNHLWCWSKVDSVTTGLTSWITGLHSCGGIVLLYLLIFSFCLQQDRVMVLAFRDVALTAHRRSVLPAVINQWFFVAITQQHDSPSIASTHELLSTGVAAVCGLSQDWQGHITLEDGPGVKLLIADGALGSNIRLALGVPVLGDAGLTEGVTTGDGYRDLKTVQAYDAGQVWILRLHLWRKSRHLCEKQKKRERFIMIWQNWNVSIYQYHIMQVI